MNFFIIAIKFIINEKLRWLIVVVLSVFGWTGYGDNIHISHCMAGCPHYSDSSGEIVVRHLYVAGMNSGKGLADWVAYRVLEDSIGVASLLPRWWQMDPLLPAASMLESNQNLPSFDQPDLSDAQDRDYRVNEVMFTREDRGRLAPLTSFAGTPFWEELNNLSNMSPLPSDLRVGAWSRLEQAINELAAQKGQLYVVSGPLYDKSGSLNIRTTNTSLPLSYFKIVATSTDYAAFVFATDSPIHSNYCDQRVTIDSIQESSGLTLFPYLESQLLPGLFSGLHCQLP